VRKKMLDRCGGVTIYAGALAVRLWKDIATPAAQRFQCDG